jgi:uroporphyrinogen-III decarboxylase
MDESVRRMRDFYAFKPGAQMVRKEFGFYVLDRWTQEGHIQKDTDLDALFGFDAPAKHDLGQLGWCEPALCPVFEEEVLEDRGAHELVRDFAGRSVLYFKGRRSGFMPEYVDHPVKDLKTFEENILWRMDPETPARYEDLDARMRLAREKAAERHIVCANLVGGYMYLRALIGPEQLLYAFYDQPELIHACMRAWLRLADHVTAVHQKYVTLDEVFLAEDICYNGGSLISPDMMREFLFPYYQQFLSGVRARQLDKARPLFVQVDTDGRATDVIDLYREAIGMNYMSPFEAACCDVVAVRKQYPDLLISGGFDKRILAAGKAEIDRELRRILSFMKPRGGYILTCDHGVPEEVSFDNYLHFRRRMLEWA